MKAFTRREFLKGTLTVGGAACCSAAFGSLGSRIAYAQSMGGNGKIFVVIHLDGGNDWHQSFDVAHTTSARAAYEQVHPVSQINPNLILPTANGYGFHPSLAGLHQIYQAGDVRVMRRVGTLSPSRSHDQEQLKFENGDFSSNGLGWMGRVMDGVARQGGNVSRFMTMAIGQGNPIDIQGASVRGLGLRDLTAYGLNSQSGVGSDQAYRQYIAQQVTNAVQPTTPITASVKDGQRAMYQSIETLQDAAGSFTGRGLSANPTLGAQYPTQSPGPQLRQIAMLIQAGLGTQLALCGMGGFDLHSAIGNENGSEANLMRNLDRALIAFRNDMVAMGKWNDVVIAIDSEFGRTIQENGSAGVDHGESIALVMLGGAISGGVSGSPVTGDEFFRNNRRPNWIRVEHHYANAYEEVLAWAGLPSNVFASHPSHNFNLL
ncbi:MAG: DUF1501 domain-containing protein [Bdellovibrionales bacterium]|nr:DUF1501 domain-containing protein [Bdellovibrionales bacterium]